MWVAPCAQMGSSRVVTLASGVDPAQPSFLNQLYRFTKCVHPE